MEDLAELLAADLEWRWRIIPTGPSNFPAKVSGALFEVEDYIAAYPELGSCVAAMLTLVEGEFVARSRWHTPPLVNSFVSRFPLLEPELGIRLVRALHDVAPLKLRILDSAAFNKSFIATSGVVLGRTTNEDEQVPHHNAEANIIYVADSSEKTTSRQQVQIDRIAYDQVRLTNLSQGVLVQAATKLVDPGTQINSYLPTLVQWSGHRIWVATKGT